MSSVSSGIAQELQQRLAKLSPAQRAVLELKLGIKSAAANVTADVIPRYDDGALAPLTPAQEVLWTLQRAMPEVFAYNVPRLLEVKGDLDPEAMRAALNAIVARHDVLRTRFVTTADGPRQKISADSAFDFEVLDLRGSFTTMDDAARDAALAELIAERVRKPFDLETGPQLRASVLQIAPDEWRVLLVLHHITSDESSRDILFRELSALYTAARQGTLDATLISLPVLPIRYADFARWQSEQSANGSLREQIDYWRDRLSGLTTLELPTDRPRTSTPSFSGARHRVTFPADVHAGVHALARKNDVTPFMILLAAMHVVLYRYTGQQDIAVGAPVSGRARAEVENVLGYFPAQVVLRTDVDPALSFSELVQRVRATCLGAFDRQDVPLEQLMNELTDRVDSQQPLFRVCVQMAGGAAS
ncbi:MAG: condensation domain-containing protein, partial [Gemmatimonadaceae bacterium]